MPDGGYGLNEEDRAELDAWQEVRRQDPIVRSMTIEWLWAYCSARGAGATPQDAARAAYVEWDL